MNPLHRYLAYGLEVITTFECPELLPCEKPGDEGPGVIRIMPWERGPGTTGGLGVCPTGQPDHDRFLFEAPAVAAYLVEHGNQVLIARAPGASDESVRLYLLGSVFGALLHQRGLLPLHGSAIEANGMAILFLGESGSGKSTLAAEFHRRGYKVVSDDICAVSVASDGEVVVFPGYPCLKLRDDVTHGAEDARRLERPTVQGLAKYRLSVTPRFCREPRPIGRVYVLKPAVTTEIRLDRLGGMRKFFSLVSNTYRPHFLEVMGRKRNHFRLCSALGSVVEICEVCRPEGTVLLRECADLLERDFPTGSSIRHENNKVKEAYPSEGHHAD